MKLIIKTDNQEIYKLKPRDIRNYIGSIVDERYKDEVLWHKPFPSKLVYPKPFKQGFEIVNYDGSNSLMYHIWEKLEENPIIELAGIKTKIKKVWNKDEEWIIPQKGLFFYKTRTPILLSDNPIEYKIVFAALNNNRADFEKYIIRRIKSDIEHRIKHYLKLDMQFDDLNLIFNNIDFALFEYKKGEKKRQGIYAEFVSNYSLPRFNGYAIGLGYGEVISQKI